MSPNRHATRPSPVSLLALVAIGLIALVALSATEASASTINVKPVRVYLGQGHTTANIQVTNTSGKSVAMQLHAVQWNQDIQGRDIEAETDEVVFFPRLFTLAPGESKAVRVGLKSANPGSAERAFRLYLQQLPVDLESRAGTLNVLLRIGVPIFLAPTSPKPQVSLSNLTLASCEVSFSLDNPGTAHVRPEAVGLKALDAEGEVAYEASRKGWYVLAGGSRLHTFTLTGDACERAERFHVDVQAGSLSTTRTFKRR